MNGMIYSMFRVFITIAAAVVLPIITSFVWLYLSVTNSTPDPLLYIALAQYVTAFTLLTVGYWLIYASSQKTTDATALIALEASEAQFRAMYDHSPIPYITTDKNNVIQFYNLSAVRLLSTTKEALLGQKLTEFFLEHESYDLEIMLQRLHVHTNVTDEEIQIQTATNDTRWVMCSVFINEQNQQRLVSLIDITEKKKVDVAKSEFLALATHQLRTPIAAIRWNLELLQRSALQNKPEKFADYFEKISRNVNRMIMLIGDFLSVSKLETGTFAASPERINLEEYLTGITDEFAQALTEKQLQLLTTCNPPQYMYTSDSRLFHIITSNLLSNAVKYTQDGGIIKWGYELQGPNLVFTVSDSGIGIPISEQGQLFSKFFRASNAQKHQTEGTGLGLYIVQQSAEKLGGTVTASSAEDAGTTFTVTLPA